MAFLKEWIFSIVLLCLIKCSFLFIFFLMLCFYCHYIFMKQVILLWKPFCLYLILFQLNRRQKFILYIIMWNFYLLYLSVRFMDHISVSFIYHSNLNKILPSSNLFLFIFQSLSFAWWLILVLFITFTVTP